MEEIQDLLQMLRKNINNTNNRLTFTKKNNKHTHKSIINRMGKMVQITPQYIPYK